jgi:hypothetical protein
MDEVDIQPVDFGDEIRYGVEPRLDLAPVVIGLPIAQNLLDGLERRADRLEIDLLGLGGQTGQASCPRSSGYATVSSSAPSSSTTGPPRLDADDTLTRFPQAIPPLPTA